MMATLENEIEAEQNRTGIRDPAHFAYSILAKATIVRRDNLKRTVSGLKDELAVTKVKLAEVSLREPNDGHHGHAVPALNGF